MPDSTLPKMIWPRMPAAERPGQVGHLERARSQDHGRRQQEREPRGVLSGQPPPHSRDHGDAVPADAGQQREDLRGADGDGPRHAHAGQPHVRLHGQGLTGVCWRLVVGPPCAGAQELSGGRAGGGRPPLARSAGPARPVAPQPGGRRGAGRGRRCDRGVGRQRGAGPVPLPGEQDEPVERQKRGRDGRLGEDHPERVLEAPRPQVPTGIVARMIIQASRWSAVTTRRSRTEVQTRR